MAVIMQYGNGQKAHTVDINRPRYRTVYLEYGDWENIATRVYGQDIILPDITANTKADISIGYGNSRILAKYGISRMYIVNTDGRLSVLTIGSRPLGENFTIQVTLTETI